MPDLAGGPSSSTPHNSPSQRRLRRAIGTAPAQTGTAGRIRPLPGHDRNSDSIAAVGRLPVPDDRCRSKEPPQRRSDLPAESGARLDGSGLVRSVGALPGHPTRKGIAVRFTPVHHLFAGDRSVGAGGPSCSAAPGRDGLRWQYSRPLASPRKPSELYARMMSRTHAILKPRRARAPTASRSPGRFMPPASRRRPDALL